MNSFDTTAEFFHQHIEHISMTVDAVADMADMVAPMVASAIMEERRVYSIGSNIDASVANTFAQLVRDGLANDRPNLPIIDLTATNSEPRDGATNWIARQIRSLGQRGDIAVIWGCQLSPIDIDALHSVLEQREMTSFWFGAQSPSHSLPFSGIPEDVRLGLCAMTATLVARLIETTLFHH